MLRSGLAWRDRKWDGSEGIRVVTLLSVLLQQYTTAPFEYSSLSLSLSLVSPALSLSLSLFFLGDGVLYPAIHEIHEIE